MGSILFPLKNLNGKTLNGYILYLGEVKQLRLSGWKGFKSYLEDSQGVLSTSPVHPHSMLERTSRIDERGLHHVSKYSTYVSGG